MKIDPRFLTDHGPEVFTGNELLLKGCLETEGGVNFLGGYPGSPVAGYFDGLSQLKDLLRDKGIRAAISNNEALAAAQLNGTQLIGARGIIVMKSVGVHVAADALALGNLAGAHVDGGAIVVYGDDPWSDSTQVPADTRYLSKHLHMPTIEPSTPQEVKDYVDLSFKLSRMSELYVGYVLTTNLADGGGTAQCRPNQYPAINTKAKIELATGEIDLNKYVLLPPKTWWREELLAERFGRAIQAARTLRLNRLDYPSASRKPLGFVTSGLAYAYLVEALTHLGLLGEFPILKLGLTYPVDGELVSGLAEHCDRLIVVEERRGFLEEQISEVLLRQRQAGRPAGAAELWGKRFPGGLEPIPEIRGLNPSMLIERLSALLTWVNNAAGGTVLTGETLHRIEGEVRTLAATGETDVPALPPRLATFCPGCPHRDTASLCLEIKKRFADEGYMRRRHKRSAVDLMFHGDTGCYTMLMYPPNTALMHDYSGMGLGGGTGAGIDPFITNKQVVFMGDSTFFHSGQLAISNAIKQGQDITFIILDNRTTAMTGHQCTPGVEYDVLGNPTPMQSIDEIVRGIAATTDVPIVRFDPEQRKAYAQLLESTFLADGVKVIIADKECGITRTRRRRRADRNIVRQKGYLPSWQHMNINTDICRFCLSCTEITGCPGLRHVQTDYGRKMDTDITWCVNDGACERVGACSSFERVTIRRKRPPRIRVPELELDNIPEPQRRPMDDLWRCTLVGFGGMGCGLTTSILVRAGHNEGYNVIFVDKKGLAIRNGGTISQIVFGREQPPATAMIPYGKTDLLIGLDILEAARAIDPRGRTRVADPQRTAAVINTDKINTIAGLMGREDFDPDQLEQVIRRHTRSADYLARNISRICEKYLGNKLFANMMMLGFAFQKGLIPVSMRSIAWAIRDTIRTDVRKNLYAFHMGRKLVVREDLFQGAPTRTGWREMLEEKCRQTVRRFGRKGQRLASELRDLAAGALGSTETLSQEDMRAFVVRLYDAMRWGGADYARRYAHAVQSVLQRDDARFGYAATVAVIYNFAAALLIKDAVFLAELSTSPEKYARDREKYNVNPANGDRIVYQHLWHPRISLLGRTFKPRLRLRPWQLKLLRRMRWLRAAAPAWHATERRHLQQYEQKVQAFAWNDAAQYAKQLRLLESAPCMNCQNPRCQEAGCPLGNHVPQWMQLAYQQRWQEASEVLHETNNFPEFTSAICPGLCEQACKRGLAEYPVAARQTEREIVDRAFAGGWVRPVLPQRRSGRKVAIIGSGPAGLAAAQQLARAGHDVVVYEKADKIGGLLRYGIPDWRLEKRLIDRRLEQLVAEGVSFRTGAWVGRDIPASQLRRDYDAVLIAVGTQRPRDLRVSGREHSGVVFALDLLRRQNLREAGQAVDDAQPTARDKVVVVIGGGETGNDCVETALKQGARSVHQLEILPPKPLAGICEPIEPHDDRVQRRWQTRTLAVESDNGQVKAIKVCQVQWAPSPSGPVMRDVPDSVATLKADMIVLAMGFETGVDASLIEQLGLQADTRGKLALRDMQGSVAGVFAAGDAVNGPSYVVTAIDSGRKAAHRIDQYLASLTQE